MIAPGFDCQFTGSFATVAGSVAADRITVSGNTSGAFTGTLLTLTASPLTITGSSNISIGNPTSDVRPGLRFTERFAAQKQSYREMSAKDLADRRM
jgi:hypothetical protein